MVKPRKQRSKEPKGHNSPILSFAEIKRRRLARSLRNLMTDNEDNVTEMNVSQVSNFSKVKPDKEQKKKSPPRI